MGTVIEIIQVFVNKHFRQKYTVHVSSVVGDVGDNVDDQDENSEIREVTIRNVEFDLNSNRVFCFIFFEIIRDVKKSVGFQAVMIY